MCASQTPLAPLYAAVVKTPFPVATRPASLLTASAVGHNTILHSVLVVACLHIWLLLGGLRAGTLGHCRPELALVPRRGAPVCTIHGGHGDGVQQLLHLWQRGTQVMEINRRLAANTVGSQTHSYYCGDQLLRYWAHAAVRTRTWPMRPVSVAKWVPPESVCRHGCRPRTGCRCLRSPSGARVHCTVGSLQMCEDEEDRSECVQDRRKGATRSVLQRFSIGGVENCK